MYNYKTATVTTEEKNVNVNLTLNGDWKTENSNDYNFLCELQGFETALSRALESDDRVGVSKNKLVTVEVSE